MTGPEQVVLLDEDLQPCGVLPKSEVHHADTPLHLAFSVYVFDPEGRLLVTRRALGKQTFAGVWSNTCCGHPGPGEDLAAAVRRRLATELGLDVEGLALVLPDFRYEAVAADGVRENEFCPVYVARTSADPVPEPSEVADWRWVDWPAFCDLAESAPWAVSPWSAEQVPPLRAVLGDGPTLPE
ncbi:MAG TPA: isopentenyl-diphosphate Delta-isomerase [Mycobacteriales bacterium]|jgi:isopentenyl-diphosphate delta-isomerase